MNTEHELFGELHEQEENGLFGNEHRRQHEAQQEALRLSAVSGSISSMKETMDSFFQKIEEEIKAEPNNMKLIGARWAYRIAMEQFNNRFQKYYP